AASTRPSASRVPCRTASAERLPAPTPCTTLSSCPARTAPSRAAARGSPAPALAAGARAVGDRRCASRGGRGQRGELDALDLGDRQLEEARAHRAEHLRLARRQEAARALARRVVLEPLARKRLRDLACRFLGGEDERHVASEHALEDRTD